MLLPSWEQNLTPRFTSSRPSWCNLVQYSAQIILTHKQPLQIGFSTLFYALLVLSLLLLIGRKVRCDMNFWSNDFVEPSSLQGAKAQKMRSNGQFSVACNILICLDLYGSLQIFHKSFFEAFEAHHVLKNSTNHLQMTEIFTKKSKQGDMDCPGVAACFF